MFGGQGRECTVLGPDQLVTDDLDALDTILPENPGRRRQVPQDNALVPGVGITSAYSRAIRVLRSAKGPVSVGRISEVELVCIGHDVDTRDGTERQELGRGVRSLG